MPYDPARHGPRRIVGPGFHEKVHALVRQVPAGRVTTYGDVAEALGSRSVARQVGFAMAALGAADVPWWRVVAAGGHLATRGVRAQQRALAAEGVAVKDRRVQEFASRRFTFVSPPP
jgi:alkylated DNA nucleotide flippase Atl1